jgi:hypothetical protein
MPRESRPDGSDFIFGCHGSDLPGLLNVSHPGSMSAEPIDMDVFRNGQSQGVSGEIPFGLAPMRRDCRCDGFAAVESAGEVFAGPMTPS